MSRVNLQPPPLSDLSGSPLRGQPTGLLWLYHDPEGILVHTDLSVPFFISAFIWTAARESLSGSFDYVLKMGNNFRRSCLLTNDEEMLKK